MNSDATRPGAENSSEAAGGSVADLTHENAELRARVKALEDAVRARDSVLSVVAHDLRSPLNIVSLAATTLLAQVSEAAARRTVERISRSVQRADQMLSDLLAISAIETGNFAIESAPVDAAELILGILESQYSLATAASVIVAADVSPDLPMLLADEKRLVDVLENLVGNAVKFTAPGGSITIGANNQGSEVLLWVKDSGVGMEPAQMPHIFDRFWQSAKKERRGIGLGLSICKAIVEAHGGRIWAESTVGVGTTMFFTIPAVA